MGEVYTARDTRLDRTVAIKIMFVGRCEPYVAFRKPGLTLYKHGLLQRHTTHTGN